MPLSSSRHRPARPQVRSTVDIDLFPLPLLHQATYKTFGFHRHRRSSVSGGSPLAGPVTGAGDLGGPELQPASASAVEEKYQRSRPPSLGTAAKADAGGGVSGAREVRRQGSGGSANSGTGSLSSSGFGLGVDTGTGTGSSTSGSDYGGSASYRFPLRSKPSIASSSVSASSSLRVRIENTDENDTEHDEDETLTDSSDTEIDSAPASIYGQERAALRSHGWSFGSSSQSYLPRSGGSSSTGNAGAGAGSGLGLSAGPDTLAPSSHTHTTGHAYLGYRNSIAFGSSIPTSLPTLHARRRLKPHSQSFGSFGSFGQLTRREMAMSTWRGRDSASVGDANEAEEGLWNLEEDEVDNEPPMLVMKPIPTRDDEILGPTNSAPSRANSLPGSKHASPRKGISVGGSPLVATQSLQVPIPMNLAPAFAASPRARGRNLSPEGRSPGSGAMSTPVDTPTGQAAEYLKFLAEHAKNVNIVMELSLEDQEVQYINNAINEVTGRAIEDVMFSPITDILHPDDASSFSTATKTLLSDPEGTVQLRVRFGIKKVVDSFTWTEAQTRPEGEVFIELEGVGMLMKESDEPSHTMWVLKAVPANEISEVSFLVNDQVSTEEVLCRICEREIAAWFFEKHNDTCDALHRLEADIAECGECLGDLRDTVLDHIAQLDQSNEEGSGHKGLLLLTLPESVTSGDNGMPLEPQLVQRRKITRSQLEDVAEILQVAKEISTPNVGEDEEDMPFYLQRYLDPESEEKLARITKWRSPPTTDRALAMLFGHVEEQVRRKQKAVARMQSTIRYSEKTRHEWEDKVNTVLAEMEGSSGSESGSESPTQAAAADTSIATTASAASASNTSMTSTGGQAGLGLSTGAGGVGVGGNTGEGEPGESPPGHRRIAPQARLPVTMSHPGRSGTAAIGETIPPTPFPQSIAPSRARSATTREELKAYNSLSTNSTPVSLAAAAKAAAASASSALTEEDEEDPSPKTIPASQVPKPMSIPMPPMHKGPFKQITPVASPLLSPLLAPSDYPTRHVRRPSKAMRDAPLSPRIPSAALTRPPPPSIKDFDIIKPISRGAFGSVFLAKKTTTGDYYAIKALKKSDMIAKNQITNVKAERTILINQASSPHVAKLFFSFQSKEYLYLVMEYLNGGDCANLVKTLHSLPEDWARNYIAEVVLGLEYMHGRGIVHRDIKPDNLLIDSRGHLKLTDFGLSRMGLMNRQAGAPRPIHLRRASARELRQRPLISRTGSASSNESPLLSPEYLPPPPSGPSLSQSYFNPIHDSGSADESSGSESVGVLPKHVRQLSMATSLGSEPVSPGVSGLGRSVDPSLSPMAPPAKFVGTPDYLAPESILGVGADDSAVDWWALGVVLYEFLYGIPPFHDESPEKVFDNVVSRRIDWHEDEVEISPEARDLMERLMCSKPEERLGAKGAQEVKDHPFFKDIDWDTIMESEASFVPEVTDPESTDYFDSRGAIHDFHDEDPAPTVLRGPNHEQHYPPIAGQMQGQGQSQSSPQSRSQSQSVYPSPSAGTINRLGSIVADLQAERERAEKAEFGAFNFKNLPVLKQANDDMIRKLRRESMSQMSSSSALSAPIESSSSMSAHQRPRSVSAKMRLKRPNEIASISTALGTSISGPSTGSAGSSSAPQSASVPNPPMGIGFQGMGMNFMGLGMGLGGAPPSPSTSTSSAASTPSRSSAAPLTPNMAMPISIGSTSNSPSSATSSSLTGAGPHVHIHGHSSSTSSTGAHAHFRRPSELSVSALDRVKGTEDADLLRRASAPFRVRAGSGGSISDRSTSMEMWRQRRQASLQTDAAGVERLGMSASGDSPRDRDRDRDRDARSSPVPISIGAPAGSTGSPASLAASGISPSNSVSATGSDPGQSPDSNMSGMGFGGGGLGPAYSGSLALGGYGFVDRTLDVLIAEDNPISQKILETLLTRMGCRCVCVEDGPQALAATMGSIRFDVIFCDMHMPVVNGEQVARMIRSTNNHNQNTPIVAATSYEEDSAISESSLFSAVLSKPISKSDLTACLARLGFVFASTSTSVSGSAIDEGSVTG